MRRTVSAALVAGILAALGVSGVADSAGPEVDLAPGRWQAPAPEPTGRERVGTVEQVQAVLGYRPAADRSVTFRYPGADYVKVHLRRLALLPGDYLTVSDPAGREVHRYQAAGPPGGQWTMSVTGDTAVVELHRTGPDPLGLAAGLAAGAVVDRVARGFVPDEPRPEPAPEAAMAARSPESICGRNDARDAVCYRSSHPTIYRHTKPVARLLIDGIELCTAFRVGPGNRLLTNHHCLASSGQAVRTEVWFNYQCASCGGWAVFRPTKVRGDRVLDTDPVLDYTLFTVDSFQSVEKFGFLELASSPARAGQELYIPQHPGGQPTRVALGSDADSGGSCAVADPQAHGYGWFTDVSYYCDTQGGSSGSPVLTRDRHRVVALHHLGGCPNSGVRIDLIRDRIAARL